MTQEKPISFTIDHNTSIGSVTLAVSELENSSQFYQKIIGLNKLNRRHDSVDLGINGNILLRLESHPGSKQHPRAPGLFHLAIRLPNRKELGHWLKHLMESRYRLGGAGDHLVSEALYLNDPEGNGIEIYYDRPKEKWEYDENGIKMNTLAVDLQALREQAGDKPFTRLPPDTIIGHIHLQVNDLNKAVEFYRNIMGFQLMALWPGAGFLSAGGYHHHIGVNVWNSRGAQPPPGDSLGLVNYEIVQPNSKAMDNLLDHLAARNQLVEKWDKKWQIQDPSQNKIILKISDAGIPAANPSGKQSHG
ncbi:MAG: VOC family protein [Calditrichota bacterium]